VSATGYQELHAIGHLAVLGGLFVVAVPLLILACTYLPWRLRAARVIPSPNGLHLGASACGPPLSLTPAVDVLYRAVQFAGPALPLFRRHEARAVGGQKARGRARLQPRHTGAVRIVPASLHCGSDARRRRRRTDTERRNGPITYQALTHGCAVLLDET